MNVNFGSTLPPAGSAERRATEPGALCARLCSATHAMPMLATPSKRMNETLIGTPILLVREMVGSGSMSRCSSRRIECSAVRYTTTVRGRRSAKRGMPASTPWGGRADDQISRIWCQRCSRSGGGESLSVWAKSQGNVAAASQSSTSVGTTAAKSQSLSVFDASITIFCCRQVAADAPAFELAVAWLAMVVCSGRANRSIRCSMDSLRHRASHGRAFIVALPMVMAAADHRVDDQQDCRQIGLKRAHTTSGL